jgi:hypothetical protein
VVDAVIAARRVAVALVNRALVAKRLDDEALVVEALVAAKRVAVALVNRASVEKSSVEVA